MDVASLTPEKLTEIYALYSYLIDLHISQVRPNVQEKSYIPWKFNQLRYLSSEIRNVDIDNKFFDFYHKFHQVDRGFKSQTQEIAFEHEKAELEH